MCLLLLNPQATSLSESISLPGPGAQRKSLFLEQCRKVWKPGVSLKCSIKGPAQHTGQQVYEACLQESSQEAERSQGTLKPISKEPKAHSRLALSV